MRADGLQKLEKNLAVEEVIIPRAEVNLQVVQNLQAL